jgi:hypothetical protein
VIKRTKTAKDNKMEIPIIITLIFIVIILSITFTFFTRKNRKTMEIELQNSQKKFKDDLQVFQNDLALFVKRYAELEEKYSLVLEVESYTKQLLDETLEKVNNIKLESERLIEINEDELEQLTVDTKEVNVRAIQKIKEFQSKVEGIENMAKSDAERVIEFAHKSAQKIVNYAYEVKQKADSYDQGIRAMRNTIAGYQDDFTALNHSLLGDEYTQKEIRKLLRSTNSTVKKNHRNAYADTEIFTREELDMLMLLAEK